MTATGTFIFICSACGYKARLPEQFAGRTIKCPGCQAPQVAVAPSNVQRKTAVITRVAATPVPFTLPKDQEDALAGIPSATPVEVHAASAQAMTAPKAFPSPLPGAIQVTTDRVARMKTPVPGDAAPPTARLATGGTVDFTCASCNAHLRLPGHYAGKSILCPKCSSPQKVAIAPEPMGTTRSLAQKADEPTAALVPATPSQPIPGSGTGIRANSVTPLPQPYPTPLPTQAPPPTPAVEAAAVESTAPVATPVITPIPADAPVEDDIAITPSQSYAKPHPSKSTSKPRVAAAAPVRASEPPAAPAKSPLGLIATAGVLVVITIGLAAGLIYHLLALSQTRERLATAEQNAKTAAAGEHEASLKLKAAEERLAELELKLKAVEEAKPATDTVPKAEEKPIDAKPAEEKPVEAKPVDDAAAPKPVEAVAPAAQP